MNMMSENVFLHQVLQAPQRCREERDGGRPGGWCWLTSGLKMCVTACNRHLLQSQHHIIYTVLNCLCSKIASMRDIWCGVANKPHTHHTYVALKLPDHRKSCFYYSKWNNTRDGEQSHTHIVLTNWNKMPNTIHFFHSVQSTCEIAKLDLVICVSARNIALKI